MNVEAEGTRIGAVIAAVRRRIAGRGLLPGEKLPSIRAMAATMRVSASTVVEAYDRLAAEGVIRSRPGAGFFVAGQPLPLTLAASGPSLDRAIDPLWVSRQSLEADDGMLKPGCGWLPASWLPAESMRRALRVVSRAEDAALGDYGTPLGHPPLRALVAQRMRERGIGVTPERVMLTESGTQAIDLVCRLLIEPGDAVLVDDPCYFNFQALLRAHSARIVGVPYTAEGPDLEALACVLGEARPRLYITNSGIHNPTGATLSPPVAHRVLQLAERFGLTIVEDDIFADFEHSPAPRLAAFDGLERVVGIGSFSKTLSASARCGWIAARPDWIEALADLKIATAFGGGRLASELVHAVLRDGGYRRHMEALRTRLARAMRETGGRLAKLGITPWLEPRGGLFLWCRLPEGVDSAALAREALTEGIVLAPGNAFSPSQTAGAFLRFNVAQAQDERIYRTLERILRAKG